ncbi:MAG TPA: hypothetical protein VFA63_17495 [Pseudonocardiaceae bacterium]|jgi:hypothetical protein|nr:hypothetical protein [Pseudonocardiaceae bacterium]
MSNQPYRDYRKHAVESLSTPIGAEDEASMIARAQVWATLALAEAIREGAATLARTAADPLPKPRSHDSDPMIDGVTSER